MKRNLCSNGGHRALLSTLIFAQRNLYSDQLSFAGIIVTPGKYPIEDTLWQYTYYTQIHTFISAYLQQLFTNNTIFDTDIARPKDLLFIHHVIYFSVPQFIFFQRNFPSPANFKVHCHRCAECEMNIFDWLMTR